MVWLPTHCWLSDCWLRLKRDDVHVQKQWGFLNTASGSSYKPKAQMFFRLSYDSSRQFFSSKTSNLAKGDLSSQLSWKNLQNIPTPLFFLTLPGNRRLECSMSQHEDTGAKLFCKWYACINTHCTVRINHNAVTANISTIHISVFLEETQLHRVRSQRRMQSIYISLQTH